MNGKANRIIKNMLYLTATFIVSAIFYFLIYKYLLPFTDRYGLRNITDIISSTTGILISYKVIKHIIRMRKEMQGRE